MRMIMMMTVGKMMVKDRVKIIKMMLLVITLPAEARFLQCELVGKKQALPSTILFSIVHAWVFSWNSLANEINRNVFHQIAWLFVKIILSNNTAHAIVMYCCFYFPDFSCKSPEGKNSTCFLGSSQPFIVTTVTNGLMYSLQSQQDLNTYSY